MYKHFNRSILKQLMFTVTLVGRGKTCFLGIGSVSATDLRSISPQIQKKKCMFCSKKIIPVFRAIMFFFLWNNVRNIWTLPLMLLSELGFQISIKNSFSPELFNSSRLSDGYHFMAGDKWIRKVWTNSF